MKKTIHLCVLAALCLFLSAKAQEKSNITPLKIGDQVPDITIKNIINYKSEDGKQSRSIKISDFKGKLLVLDFWATWCSPCVAMIPKMEELQANLSDKLQFLPVTYQSEDIILPFLNKRREKSSASLLPQATGDHVLGKLFPHTYLPHYVWIGPDGTVKAITGHEEVTKANIIEILSGTSKKLTEKQDARQIPYDGGKPLFIDNNGGDGQKMIYHSLLSQYTVGLTAGFGLSRDSLKGVKISIRNNPLSLVYRVANWDRDWFGTNRTVVLVKDTSKLNSELSGAPYLQWMSEGNGYSYELTLPPYLTGKENEIMRTDLDRLFPQYRVGVEKRKVTCLALVRTSQVDKIRSEGGAAKAEFSPDGFRLHNTSLWYLLQRLNMVYFQNTEFSLADDTGYTGAVDLVINASLNDIAAINEQLKQYDLALKAKVMEVDMLVFRDSPGSSLSPKL